MLAVVFFAGQKPWKIEGSKNTLENLEHRGVQAVNYTQPLNYLVLLAGLRGPDALNVGLGTTSKHPVPPRNANPQSRTCDVGPKRERKC